MTSTFDPIDERIIQNVVETLEQMSQASGFAADYTVTRDKPNGVTPRDGLICVVGRDPVPTDVQPVGLDQYELPVMCVVFAVRTDANETTIKTWLRRYAADIRRKLGQDLHRGGLAANTRFMTKDTIMAGAGPAAAIVTASVQYRTRWDNPYEQ